MLGQILPGVPVISAAAGRKGQTIPYVIFPGNVGDERALLDVLTILADR